MMAIVPAMPAATRLMTAMAMSSLALIVLSYQNLRSTLHHLGWTIRGDEAADGNRMTRHCTD
jgi:hypothetical protein